MAEAGGELAGHACHRTPREPVAFCGVAHQPGVTLIPALGSRRLMGCLGRARQREMGLAARGSVKWAWPSAAPSSGGVACDGVEAKRQERSEQGGVVECPGS